MRNTKRNHFSALILTLTLGSQAHSFIGGQSLAQDHGDQFPDTHSIVAVVNEPATIGWLCTGVLIAPDVVLTASHCLTYGSQTSIVFSNNVRAPSLQGLVRSVDQSLEQPSDLVSGDTLYNIVNNQNYYMANDIALLHFTGGLPPGYAPAPYLTNPSQLVSSLSVAMAGYGVTNSNDSSTMGHLTGRTAIPISQMGNDDNNGEPTLIFFDESQGYGICVGDSGGPVTAKIGGRTYVVGLNVAMTSTSCDAQAAAVAIAPYAQWIATSVKALEKPK